MRTLIGQRLAILRAAAIAVRGRRRRAPMVSSVCGLIAVAALLVLTEEAQAVDVSASAAPTELEAVSATSATSAWAVGYRDYGAESVIIRWDGVSWSPVASPVASELYGVSSVSPSEAWAVGSSSRAQTHTTQTLVLHWDGSAWSKVPSPNVGFFNPLEGVSAASAKVAWAVGEYVIRGHRSHALALRWNGTTWSTVPVPGRELHAVVALSSKNAWAVGFGLLLHWNGARWSKEPVRSRDFLETATASELMGVSAVSSRDVWAVGQRCAHFGACVPRTDVIHWNGRRWSPVPSPAPSRFFSTLYGVSELSADNVWAVGSYCTTANCSDERALIIHWNGRRWSTATTPHPGSSFDVLAGTAAVSASQVWAVGANANDRTSSNPLLLDWNGTVWSAS